MRFVGCIVVASVVALVGARAVADEARVATAVVLRERADEASPVVARLAEGAMVTLVARRADGWVQVKSGNKRGWANRSFFKLPGAAQGAPLPGEPAATSAGTSANERSLVAPHSAATAEPAPPASPRPHLDGWVNQSTWMRRRGLAAEVLQPSGVHARTDEESRVVATLVRGQRIRLARLSADEAWGLVRSDEGDVGWVSMRTVRVRGTLPIEEEAAATAAAGAASGSTDTRPGGALGLVARPLPPDRRDAILLVADAGVAVIARRYVSNGAGPLASYELAATTVTSGVSGSYGRRFGSLGIIGVDLAYAYASGARVRYAAGDGMLVTLHLQSHDAEGGLRLGLHSRAAGGVDVWLRAGALVTVTIFDPDPTVRLQSDRLIAPTVGLGLAAPHLVALGRRWLGVDLFGRAIVFGQTSENLDEGRDRGTLGGRFGGDLTFELWRAARRGQLILDAGYSYTFSVARFDGPSVVRDPSATQATLGTAQHLAALAIGYAY